MKKIEELLKRRPGLQNMVVTIINGVPVTLKELYERMKSGDKLALEAAEKLGMDPTDEEWAEMAKAYWKKLEKTGVTVYFRGRMLTPKEIVEHIEKMDEVGRFFVEMYKNGVRKLIYG